MWKLKRRERCAQCGARVRRGMALCWRCGSALSVTKAADLCPDCGAQLESEAHRCPICGAIRAGQRLGHRSRRGRVALAALALAVPSLILWRLATGPWREVSAREMAALVQMVSTRVNLPTLVEEPTATPTKTPRPTRTWTPTPQPSLTPTLTMPPTAASTEAVETVTQLPVPTEPVAAAPADLSPTPAPLVHVIASGEHLGILALRYGVSSKEIARANGIEEDTILRIGQELIIPVDPPAVTATAELHAVASSPTVSPTAAPVSPTPTLALGGLAGLALLETGLTPTATPTPVATPTPILYTVAKGDNLGSIAVKHGVSSVRIAEANGLTLNSVLSIGQVLLIPGPETDSGVTTPDASVAIAAGATPTTNRTPLPTPTATPTPAVIIHTVAKGDILGSIAVRYGVTSEQIAAANGITLRTVLQVGQQLRIPGVAATAEPTAPPDPTATLTPSPTVAPTRTRLPTPQFTYREPTLLWPTNGSAISGPDLSPVMNWTSVGILSENEWYLLRIWNPGQPEEPFEVYTKATSYRLTSRAYPQGRRLQRFAWQVVVVHRSPNGQTDTPLSPPSAEYAFIWR